MTDHHGHQPMPGKAYEEEMEAKKAFWAEKERLLQQDKNKAEQQLAAFESAETEQTIEDAFPNVDPRCTPVGARIMVQLRRPKKRVGKIQLIENTRETEKWTGQVGLVREIGPLAFRKRDTMEPWPEGSWCKVGDFIRVPVHGGDRWEVPIPGTDETAIFLIMNDHEIISKVTGDPMSFKVFV